MEVELACRVILAVVRQHHTQLVGSRALAQHMQSMANGMRRLLQTYKDVMGFNSAGLAFLHRELTLLQADIHFVDLTAPKNASASATSEEALVPVKRPKFLSDEVSRLQQQGASDESEGAPSDSTPFLGGISVPDARKERRKKHRKALKRKAASHS